MICLLVSTRNSLERPGGFWLQRRTGMIAACFWSSRANKAASRAQLVFATVFAAGAMLFCTCGAAAPKIAETLRVDLPAPSALHGIKIDTNESALDLKRTEALLATYLCPIADYLAEIAQKANDSARAISDRLGKRP